MCCDVLDFWFLKTLNSLVVECVESLLCAFAREFWYSRLQKNRAYPR
jgi:hypothetical protein